MSIAAVVTRGYGTFGTITLVVTAGYSSGTVAPPVVAEEQPSLGANWKLKKKRLTIKRSDYAHQEEYAAALAGALALEAVPMSQLPPVEAPFDEQEEEDDALLMRALTSIIIH